MYDAVWWVKQRNYVQVCTASISWRRIWHWELGLEMQVLSDETFRCSWPLFHFFFCRIRKEGKNAHMLAVLNSGLLTLPSSLTCYRFKSENWDDGGREKMCSPQSHFPSCCQLACRHQRRALCAGRAHWPSTLQERNPSSWSKAGESEWTLPLCWDSES